MLTYRKFNTSEKTGFLSTKKDCLSTKKRGVYFETISITRGVNEYKSMVMHASL